MAASAGLGYIETFTRDQLPYVTVYEGDHQYGRGDALIEVIAGFGEHPHALLRRALAQAAHARTERQLRAELDRLRPPADLPATLASVDDVRRVCLAAGFPGKDEETTTPWWVVPGILTVTWMRHPGAVYLYRHPSGEHYGTLFPGSTGAELYAVIQAARSAS